MLRNLLAIAAVVSVTFSPLAASADFKVPQLSGPVVDNAGIVSTSLQNQLTAALTELSRSGLAQMAILTVPDLGGETIEQASIKVADQWKLGTAAKDNGILLMISRGDRKVRIEVGKGLEGDLPDAYAGRIVSDTILPLFRNGDYESGILLGTREILSKAAPNFAFDSYISERPMSAPQRAHTSSSWLTILLLLLFARGGGLFFWGLFIFFMVMGRGRNRGRSSFWGTGGWGGGYGGGFGGGGFGGGGFSGGGGGFNGGGASGGW